MKNQKKILIESTLLLNELYVKRVNPYKEIELAEKLIKNAIEKVKKKLSEEDKYTLISDVDQLTKKEKEKIAMKFGDSKFVLTYYGQPVLPLSAKKHLFFSMDGVIVIARVKSWFPIHKDKVDGVLPRLGSVYILAKNKETKKIKFINLHWRTKN